MGVLVEVAELFSAKGGALATDSGDFDMSAGLGGWRYDGVLDDFDCRHANEGGLIVRVGTDTAYPEANAEGTPARSEI